MSELEKGTNSDKEDFNETERGESSSPTNRWPMFAAFVFFFAMVGGIAFAVRERTRSERLASDYSRMSVDLSGARSQLANLTSKLDALSSQPESTRPVMPSPAAGKAEGKRPTSKATSATRKRAEDPRWKQVQSELSEHQQQLEAARQDLEKTRTDLENRLNSSHDELNGSIARNHEELVALGKRGERNYYEFELVKSKELQQAGPIRIALRKADTKHLFCDFKLLVDDKLLTKKHVNLYEPVQFYPADYAQPLEIVIFEIGKKQARGYVSAPRYRQSELSAAQTSSAGTTADAHPVSAPTANSADLQRQPLTPR